VGKVACWSIKAAISLKRVKIKEKLLSMAYRKSPTLFQTAPFPTTIRPSFSYRFATPAQNCNRYYLRTGKATDCKFGRYFHRVHPNKSPLKIWRKGSMGVSRDCPFLGTPYYLGNG